MKDANKILEDAALDLAVQMIDTKKQARDLEDAFDITTDSSLDVAKAEVTLTKAIKSKTNAIGRSIDHIDTAAYTQRDTAQVEKEYQDALIRRTKLENQISTQKPIIDYASKNPDKIPKQEQPPETADKPEPKSKSKSDKPESLSDYLDKKNLGDIKKFKAELDKVKDDQKKQRGLFKKIAIGGLAVTAGATLGGIKGAASFAGSSLESAMGLQQIPMYNESKQLTKFALNKTSKAAKSVSSGISSKLIERRFNKEREKTSSEFHASKETNSQNIGEVISDKQNDKKEKTEQKTERVDNKRERNENEKRHKSVLGALGDIGKAILFSAITKMGVGLLSNIAGVVSTIAGTVLRLLPVLSGLAATIIAGFVGAMDGLLGKIIPGYKPTPKSTGTTKPTGGTSPETKPTATPDSKSTKPSTTIEDAKSAKTAEPQKTGNTPKSIAGDAAKTAGNDVAKKPGFMSRMKNMGSKVAGVVEEAAMKGPTSKLAAKKMGWVGNAILAFDIAYVIADKSTDGELSKVVDKHTAELNSNMDKLAPTYGKVSDAERVTMTKEQADIKQKAMDDAKAQRAMDAQRAMYQSTNVSNKSSTTNVYGSGFTGVQPDSKYRMPSNGIQPMR